MNKKIIFLIIFFIILLIPFVSRAAVVINEVLYDPDGTDTGLEYIILYNNGDAPYSLTNHCLYASTEHYIFGSFNLGAKEKVVIHWNAEGSNTTTDLYTSKTSWSSMGNTSGSVALFLNHVPHSSSNILDFIQYTKKETWESAAVDAGIWAACDFIADAAEGKAIKLKTDGIDNNSSSDWMSATPSITQEESQEQTQTTPETPLITNNQLPIADAGDNIIAFIDDEITFNGSKSHDPDGLDLAYEWNLGEGGVKNDDIVKYKYAYSGTYLVTLTVFDGRYYGSDTITVEIYPKKITINEFLPSPAGKDEEGEWTELYNNSDQIINISGWQLDDEDGGSKPYIFPKNTLIAPKSYLVFPRPTTKIALNNDKGEIRLLLSTGMVFQKISYEKAPEGKSSARTPEGFVWSTPTPGLPNIIDAENKNINYSQPLQTEATNYSSKNLSLNTWINLPQQNSQKDLSKNLIANLGQTSENTNYKLILIIAIITLVILAAVLGFLKLKKKL